MNRAEFLDYVRRYVAEDPEAAPHIAAFAQAGLQEALGKAYERTADMEVALATALSPALRKANGKHFIRSKLQKWAGKTACRWDWYTEDQQGAANPTPLAPEGK